MSLGHSPRGRAKLEELKRRLAASVEAGPLEPPQSTATGSLPPEPTPFPSVDPEQSRLLRRDFQGTEREYQDYADEAWNLAWKAAADVARAEATLSKTDLDRAINALREAAAMHQRAFLSAIAGGRMIRAHHTAYTHLGIEAHRMRRVRPTSR